MPVTAEWGQIQVNAQWQTRFFEKIIENTAAYTTVCEDFSIIFSKKIGSQCAFSDTE